FINAHTHLELSCYAGRLSPGPFWNWIERLIALRREPGAATRELQAVVDGAKASLRAGVTCVGDVSRTGRNVNALRGIPIRSICFIELISGAATPPGDPDQLLESLRQAEASADEMTTLGISPHALYSVTWSDLRRTVAIAADRDAPVAIHLAETPEEIEWL